MEVLQFILDNWIELSSIVAGGTALGVGARSGVRTYQKIKDKRQDEEIERNREDIDKLIADMEGLAKALSDNFARDQEFEKIAKDTNSMMLTVVKELKEFKEKYFEDRIHDREMQIMELQKKK